MSLRQKGRTWLTSIWMLDEREVLKEGRVSEGGQEGGEKGTVL